MFTGLVEGLGRVKEISPEGGDIRLTIEPLFDMSDIRVGDSISVSGVCLTVTTIAEAMFSVDVSAETISRSTVGRFKRGDLVNLERALRFTDRLGGHLVSGHIDGVGRILKIDRIQRSWRLRIGIGKDLAKYTIEKGSIAVDGISLTINRCHDTFFEVNIIPQTAKETTILNSKVGDAVNIETDLIGKYVEKFFNRERGSQKDGSAGISQDMLIKHGFGD